MTNHTTPRTKTLLAAAFTASVVLSLSACGSTSAKPTAANAPGAGSTTTAISAPSANPPQLPPATAPTTATADQNQPSKTMTRSATKASTAKPTTPASGIAADCTVTHLKATVTPLTRPINHVLLTVTNTSGATCSLYYYPDLRLDPDQQAVTQAVEDSKPQAVVSIAPGASAYAAIGTSAADGSGGHGKVEKQVQVYLETKDQSGSLQGSLTLPLPAGTYVDDKAFVTYWQSDLQSAIAW
jgi:hypothetical protein